jgi:hypothetical protein
VSEKTFSQLQKTVEERLTFKTGDDFVRVAILDTGIDLLHASFQKGRLEGFRNGNPILTTDKPNQRDRIIACQNFCPKPWETTTRECGDELDEKEKAKIMEDLNGHGTQVAGIVLRLAPNARLLIARVCNGDQDVVEAESISGSNGAAEDEHARPSAEAVCKVGTSQVPRASRPPYYGT